MNARQAVAHIVLSLQNKNYQHLPDLVIDRASHITFVLGT
jgi:hypothetical protein